MRNLTLLILCALAGYGCVAPPRAPSKPASRQIGLASSRVALCVVEDTVLRRVDGMIDPATGDTLVNGRRFSEAYPSTAPPYAGQMAWYQDRSGDFIQLGSVYFIRWGPARIRPDLCAGPSTVVHVGDLQGVPIFAERAVASSPEVLYLPVQVGGTFQGYQRRCVATAPPLPGTTYIDCGPLPRPALQATPVGRPE